jgi:hypothetical protein
LRVFDVSLYLVTRKAGYPDTPGPYSNRIFVGLLDKALVISDFKGYFWSYFHNASNCLII